MEKLIELLNKFEREAFPEEHEYVEFPDGTDDDGGYWYYREQPNMGENKGFNYSSRSDKRNCEINQLLIISKEFGFIKWLVDNDKIVETEVRPIQIYDYEGKYCDDEFGYSWFNQGLYYEVIMELAISDKPIDFLISILK